MLDGEPGEEVMVHEGYRYIGIRGIALLCSMIFCGRVAVGKVSGRVMADERR